MVLIGIAELICVRECLLTNHSTYPYSNQVLIVEFMCTTVDTSFVFTKKNQALQNVFLISVYAEIAQCSQKLDVILVNKVIQKNVFYKKCGLKLIFFDEKRNRKIRTFLR